MTIKILIADDQRLFRQGLRSLLEQEKDMEVVGEAADGQEAFTVVQETKPDIVLMDVEMPKLNGIHATRMILERHSHIKILMLSVHNEDEKVIAAIRSGAVGYILKDADHNEFVSIIRSTFAGEQITSPFLANLTPRILNKIHDPSKIDEEIEIKIKEKFSFTKREREILELLLKGNSNKEIANLTYVSTETVKSHLQHIYRKIGVKSRLETVALFLKQKRTIPSILNSFFSVPCKNLRPFSLLRGRFPPIKGRKNPTFWEYTTLFLFCYPSVIPCAVSTGVIKDKEM